VVSVEVYRLQLVKVEMLCFVLSFLSLLFSVRLVCLLQNIASSIMQFWLLDFCKGEGVRLH